MERPAHTQNQDLSALAWVQDELGKSLDTAHKALRRCLKEVMASSGADMDDIDPAILRAARLQIHQGVGALELVGLPAGATLLRASEAAVQRYAAKPRKLDSHAVETIEQASFALLDYIGRLLGARPMPAVALFAQYKAIQELAGAERVHPADLWEYHWRWMDLPVPDVESVSASPQAVSVFESGLLGLMRRPRPEVASQLALLCAGLGNDAQASARSLTLWRLAQAFFEAMACGAVPVEVYTKRVASNLLSHLRTQVRGGEEVPQRLAQDLLFFCAHAAPPTNDTPPWPASLNQVRRIYALETTAPVNYQAPLLGRYDPAWVVQARKRVASAKDAWSAVAGGDLHRLHGLHEQFVLVGESIQRLYPGGDWLARALQEAVGATVHANAAPQATLAMEVATSVLYLEASLEDLDFDHPDQSHRIRRLAARIDAVRQGQAPEPLEVWMEELYRRVSDRQTLGSVVQELRASLADVEKHIDEFFRVPTNKQPLIPVPQLLQTMRGVLSVLGVDQGAQAVVRMRDDVESLVMPRAGAPEGTTQITFDRLARNLGALGFLIDMLGVQPQVAKSLFVFHIDSGLLSPVMGRAEQVAPVIATPTPVASPELPRLIEEAQALAEAAQNETALDVISTRLGELADDPTVQAQPELAQVVAFAQSALDQATRPDALGEVSEWAAREEVAQAMAEFSATASAPLTALPSSPPASVATPATSPLPPPPPSLMPLTGTTPAPAPTVVAALDDDDEMLDIFLEEASDVITQAREALTTLGDAPNDGDALTLVRRSFHTLKGSSRMVGLNDFGEAAWACEQLYNAWLAENKPASEELLGFTAQALGYLGAWVGEIEDRQPVTHISAPLCASAHALRVDGLWQPLAPAGLDIGSTQTTSATATVPSDDAAISLNLPPLQGQDDDEAFVPTVITGRQDLSPSDDLPSTTEAVDFHEVDFALPTVLDEAGVGTTPTPLIETLEPSALVSADVELPLDLAPNVTEPEPERVVGHLHISEPLYDIYLNEADDRSKRLCDSLHAWAQKPPSAVPEDCVDLAHSLAGSSATVGYVELSRLARQLEHAQMRSRAFGRATPDEVQLFVDAAEEVRGLLHQFAAGFLKAPSADILERLAQHEADSALRLEDAPDTSDRINSGPMPLSSDDDLGADFVPPEYVADDSVCGPLTLPDTPITLREDLPSQPPAPPAARKDPGETTRPTHLETATPDGLTGLSAPSTFGSLVEPELPSLQPLSDAGFGSLQPIASGSLDTQAGTLDDDIDAVDAVDADLFPIFEEEGQDLLTALATQMRAYHNEPGTSTHIAACMRTLHTLKGGARLAGAMRLGEMAHRLETAFEHLSAQEAQPTEVQLQQLQAQVDALSIVFEGLRARDAQAYAQAEQAARDALAEAISAAAAATPADSTASLPPSTTAAAPSPSSNAPTDVPDAAPTIPAGSIDWSRFSRDSISTPTATLGGRSPSGGLAAVRVRPQLLDRMVNTAGEVGITRAKLNADIAQIRSSLNDLTDNLERLRTQMRGMELQAETQMTSRMEAARAASQDFDPLEFDRFTRFQELSRMTAESLNDVATVHRNLMRSVESTEDVMAAQLRLTRELQEDLLRTRMVEFESLSDRLYRVVRLASKETGKQVRLDLRGGQIEVDRSVLERMTGTFEHLLRNSVAHGIEPPQTREAAGKDATGTIMVSVHQEGNEVAIEVRDDGAGLDLTRIRTKAQNMGLLSPGQAITDGELAQLIFTPGFTTAERVTELAGRGVGMDVVRADVNAIGGRIETATTAGQGTNFKLVLPLTTAVTQVVMLRCGQTTVAVPSTLIDIVLRAPVRDVETAYTSGTYLFNGQPLPFYWLGSLLQASPRGAEGQGRTLPVIIVKSAQQRVALHVDEVLGNQEVVVKNLGPQLSRLPGLAGMTLLVSGAVALIYNPVALATVYGEAARRYTLAALQGATADTPPPLSADVATGTTAPTASTTIDAPVTPAILVVDDSLTVRRVTQRLLVREGYRVTLAKDGLDALEKLAQERPAVVLSDIEMPRMDGFDLLRNIRADAKLVGLPVVMITSRIAQKHRDYAQQLGANHYLGKPYSEEELLGLVRTYTQAMVDADDSAAHAA